MSSKDFKNVVRINVVISSDGDIEVELYELKNDFINKSNGKIERKYKLVKSERLTNIPLIEKLNYVSRQINEKKKELKNKINNSQNEINTKD